MIGIAGIIHDKIEDIYNRYTKTNNSQKKKRIPILSEEEKFLWIKSVYESMSFESSANAANISQEMLHDVTDLYTGYDMAWTNWQWKNIEKTLLGHIVASDKNNRGRKDLVEFLKIINTKEYRDLSELKIINTIKDNRAIESYMLRMEQEGKLSSSNWIWRKITQQTYYKERFENRYKLQFGEQWYPNLRAVSHSGRIGNIKKMVGGFVDSINDDGSY